MSKANLPKRNDYMESPNYTPEPAIELQLEYTKLVAVFHALDSISETANLETKDSDIFYGSLRIMESIIPRIRQIQAAM